MPQLEPLLKCSTQSNLGIQAFRRRPPAGVNLLRCKPAAYSSNPRSSSLMLSLRKKTEVRRRKERTQTNSCRCRSLITAPSPPSHRRQASSSTASYLRIHLAIVVVHHSRRRRFRLSPVLTPCSIRHLLTAPCSLQPPTPFQFQKPSAGVVSVVVDYKPPHSRHRSSPSIAHRHISPAPFFSSSQHAASPIAASSHRRRLSASHSLFLWSARG
jgi:hypothetical protein